MAEPPLAVGDQRWWRTQAGNWHLVEVVHRVNNEHAPRPILVHPVRSWTFRWSEWVAEADLHMGVPEGTDPLLVYGPRD